VTYPGRPAAKSLAELIGGALDPLVRKRGLARAELIQWWPDIVGAAYAGRTAPERIRWGRDGRAATLVIRCDPALALQLSYETERVRERLNGYLGYPAVASVKIVQQRIGEPEPPAKPARQAGALPPDVEAKLGGCEGPLGESLRALGRQIFAGS